jgi:hypothetical protein
VIQHRQQEIVIAGFLEPSDGLEPSTPPLHEREEGSIHVRADEERLLARSPQKSTGCSEEDTIGVLQTRAADLSAKNHKLMSEHDDLELLEITRTQTQRRYRVDAPKQQIHQT